MQTQQQLLSPRYAHVTCLQLSCFQSKWHARPLSSHHPLHSVCATETIIFAVAIRVSVSKYFCRNHCPVQDSGTKRMELPPRSLRPTCTPRQGCRSLTHSLTQSVTRSCTELFLDLCDAFNHVRAPSPSCCDCAPLHSCILPTLHHSLTHSTHATLYLCPSRRVASQSGAQRSRQRACGT